MIIGLYGKARSGKDTVGKFLQEKGFVRLSFAGPIKEGLSSMLNLSMNYFEDTDLKERQFTWLQPHVTPRFLMQTLGTEWGRDTVQKDLWLSIMKNKVSRLRPGSNVVITDVRFPDEAEWVQSTGGEVWKVLRPSMSLGGSAARHSSEAGISEELVSRVVSNIGTLDELRREVHLMLSTHFTL